MLLYANFNVLYIILINVIFINQLDCYKFILNNFILSTFIYFYRLNDRYEL